MIERRRELEALWSMPDLAPDWCAHPGDRVLFTPFGGGALVLARNHGAGLFLTDREHHRPPRGRLLLEELRTLRDLALGYVSPRALEPRRGAGLDLCLGKPFAISKLVAAPASVVERPRRGTYTPPPERMSRIHRGGDVP